MKIREVHLKWFFVRDRKSDRDAKVDARIKDGLSSVSRGITEKSRSLFMQVQTTSLSPDTDAISHIDH